MSGHSKWSTIKHRKAAQDAKRGAAFNKLIRELVVAAREGGADPAANYALASAVEKARASNMPKDTMDKAIKRGAGESGGETYQRSQYEGRGPAGVALIVDALTDNKNRTVADLRHIFARHGGQLCESGSVLWMFDRKGLVVVKAPGVDEDTLMEHCMEAGADDFKVDGEQVEIYTVASELHKVRVWLREHKYNVESAEIALIAKEQVEITDENQARKLFRLLDSLEENDDVQGVHSNWSMSDALVEAATE